MKILSLSPHFFAWHFPLGTFDNFQLFTFNFQLDNKDHLGNNRLSYTLDPETNQIKILEENHYYPFGLKHGAYNQTRKDVKYQELAASKKEVKQVVPEAVKFKYYYQSLSRLDKGKVGKQERQDELGLNWDSFKYRNYDYAIRRFMSVDPLAEKYPYNSTYAFQENKMGLGRELEGLELEARDENTGVVGSGPVDLDSNDNLTEVETTAEGWSESLPAVTVTYNKPPQINTNDSQTYNPPEIVSEPTESEIQLGKYYEELHQQAENERKNLEAMYLREPVFSGYYGGANQYPVISSAMFSLISPDALIMEGVATTIETGANAYRIANSWSNVVKMTGKGMTFTKKGKMYRNSIRISNQMLRVSKSVRNISGADGTFSILQDIYNYYQLPKKIKNENN